MGIQCRIMPSTRPWAFYIIANRHKTYAGVSPDPIRRLRQHNGEITGGAKYTTSAGPGWYHVCIIEGFPESRNALQFEWAVKHERPRGQGGLEARIKKLYRVLEKERWTSNAPVAQDVPLALKWFVDPPSMRSLPPYIGVQFVSSPLLRDPLSTQIQPCKSRDPVDRSTDVSKCLLGGVVDSQVSADTCADDRSAHEQ